MIRILSLCSLVLVFSLGAMAQQPNSPAASMIWAGQDGPPFPISVTWNSTAIGMAVSGPASQPYAIAQSGALAAGALPLGAAGIVDLDPLQMNLVQPFLMDGIAMGTGTLLDTLANTGPTGQSNWVFPIPANGSLGAFQAVVLQPAGSPAGFVLSAASDVTIVVAQNLFVAVPGGGDDITVNVPLAFGSIDFYDVNYTDIFISSNGNVTLGGADANFAPTNLDFDTGFPRMAPLWADLLPGIAIAQGNFVNTIFETLDGVTVRWVGMDNYSNPALGASTPVGTTNNTYSVTYNYSNVISTLNPLGAAGTIVFDYTLAEPIFLPPFPGGVNADWGISGITPGGTLPASPTNPTSLAIDPAPFISNYNAGGDLLGNGTPSFVPTNPMQSYRTDVNSFPVAEFYDATLLQGTGLQVSFLPVNFIGGQGVANTYLMQ